MAALRIALAYDASVVPAQNGEAHDEIARGAVVDVAQAIGAALAGLGHDVVKVGIDFDLGATVARLRAAAPDVVFNLCESLSDISAHEIGVAAVFDILGIPYTGSGPVALSLALHKARTKEILAYHGVRTAKHLVLESADFAWEDTIDFPIIVKPAHEDASVGISADSVVADLDALRARVEYVVKTYAQPALVETYIAGRELNVAVVGNDPPEVLPISEIDFSSLPKGQPKIVSYKAKWLEDSPEYKGTAPICPAKLEFEVEARVRATALKAYKLVGCRDYARVDMRLSRGKVPYVLEVNPNPDLSPDAGLPRAARVRGWEYPELVQRIVDFARARTVRGRSEIK
ncbi:MAG: D-alanine--D-alanine ligase [Planctomycetes bacterium]|nr:D-alanine--D-alanine ligase [Planctomycetota bacterium]